MTDKEIISELKNFVDVFCDDVSDRPSGCDYCKLYKDGNCAVDVLYEKIKAENEDKK